MSLQQKIYDDLKQALKDKAEPKLSTLRLLKSDIQYELTKTGDSTISDETIISLIKKNVVKRRDTAVEYRKANREDLAAKEDSEAVVLEAYLPPSLPEEEIRKAIAQTIEQLKPKPTESGKVIGKVMSDLKGRNADGGLVAKLVKAMLSDGV